MIAHLMYIFSYTNEEQKWIRSLWPSHTPGATWDGCRNSHEGARAYQGGRSLGHASATAMIWHTIDLIYYVIFIRHTHTYRENKIRPSNILFVRVPYIFGPMFQAQTYIYIYMYVYLYIYIHATWAVFFQQNTRAILVVPCRKFQWKLHHQRWRSLKLCGMSFLTALLPQGQKPQTFLSGCWQRRLQWNTALPNAPGPSVLRSLGRFSKRSTSRLVWRANVMHMHRVTACNYIHTLISVTPTCPD